MSAVKAYEGDDGDGDGAEGGGWWAHGSGTPRGRAVEIGAGGNKYEEGVRGGEVEKSAHVLASTAEEAAATVNDIPTLSSLLQGEREREGGERE